MTPKEHFDSQLDALKQRLLDMSHSVEEQVGEAVSLATRQESIEPEEILERDAEIDDEEVAIEETAIELLALHQPMAIDLRTIVTILKINNDLERVGDHAVNIAEAVLRLRDKGQYPPVPPQLEEMNRLSRGILRDALDAFVNLDAETARQLGARDDEVDALHESVFRVMLTHMLDQDISACLQMLLISRNIERIADHAVNIGEDVVYLVQGRTIRHTGGKEEEGGEAPVGAPDSG